MQNQEYEKKIITNIQNKKIVINGQEFDTIEEAEEARRDLMSNGKKKLNLMKAQLKSKQGREAFPQLDGFGKPKPETGFGSLSRHERRSAKKRHKMK